MYKRFVSAPDVMLSKITQKREKQTQNLKNIAPRAKFDN